jgi:hypothetical protein
MSTVSSIPSTPSFERTPRSSTADTVLQTPTSSKANRYFASRSPPFRDSSLHTASTSTSRPSSPTKRGRNGTDRINQAQHTRRRRWASQLRVKLEDVLSRRVATANASVHADEGAETPDRAVDDKVHHFFGELQLVAEPEGERE